LRGYRIVDLELGAPKPPVGRTVAEVPWPLGSTVLAIRRGGDAFEPSASDRLEQGDHLTVRVPAATADDLVDAITSNGDAQA
jgi:Trk K+ transport system NAD-binding subunit